MQLKVTGIRLATGSGRVYEGKVKLNPRWLWLRSIDASHISKVWIHGVRASYRLLALTLRDAILRRSHTGGLPAPSIRRAVEEILRVGRSAEFTTPIDNRAHDRGATRGRCSSGAQ